MRGRGGEGQQRRDGGVFEVDSLARVGRTLSFQVCSTAENKQR